MSSDRLENIKCIKYILKTFEVMSGLKVNFHKCSIIGVNVEGSTTLENMAAILKCKVGEVPFNYLGVRVGSSLSRISYWSHVVRKVRKRLKTWEDKKLSFGERITLVNSVLTALPIYHLLFSILPKKSLGEIVALQHNFLWGGGEQRNKMAWLRWEEICKPKLVE